MNLSRRTLFKLGLVTAAATITKQVALCEEPVEVERLVTTGFASLDREFGGGFRRGCVYLILGDIGSGKTSFLKQFSAINANVPGIVTFELEHLYSSYQYVEFGGAAKVRSHVIRKLQQNVCETNKVAVITCPVNRNHRIPAKYLKGTECEGSKVYIHPSSMMYRATGVISLTSNCDRYRRSKVEILKNRFCPTRNEKIEIGFSQYGMIEITDYEVIFHPYGKTDDPCGGYIDGIFSPR